MREMKAQVRAWGRSLGVVIPKDVVAQERLKAGDTVNLLVGRRTNPIQKSFGTFKFRKTTRQLLKEVDKESWDE